MSATLSHGRETVSARKMPIGLGNHRRVRCHKMPQDLAIGVDSPMIPCGLCDASLPIGDCVDL
jgi:hypothetical protein